VLSCSLVATGTSRADTFSSYQAAGSFTLPGSTVALDSLPDGRILTVVGSSVFRETASGSRVFTNLGALPNADIPSFGAAFVRASPDGTKIAVGNNGGASFANYKVGVFTIAGLAGTWFSANHLDAAWIDNRFLAVTAGNFGSPAFVTALDTTSPNPASPSNVTIVTNIGGASGGIAFDAGGNLYSANGFTSSGPSQTGAVYAILSASWHAALSGGTPPNFESQGIPIVDLLSGDPLGFDAAGDLVVGGGNSFSPPIDDNYFAIVRASAVQQALAGGGLISTSDTTKVMKLDPDPGADSVYAVDVNRARTDIYAVSSGSATAYVYHGTATAPEVPAVPPAGVALLSAALAAVGGRISRRRKG
jgi:hypothetical protein